MTRSLFKLIFSICLLIGTASAGVTKSSVCSKEPYKTLVPLLGKDAKVIKFCNALPSESNFAKASKPNSLKNLAYTVLKTFCDCLKASTTTPTPPAPSDDASCSAKNASTPNFCPGPPSTCSDFYAENGDNKNCGSCGKQCPNDLPCSYGSCAECSDTMNAPCPNKGNDPQFCFNGYCSRCPNGGTDCDPDISPPLCCTRGPDIYQSCITKGSRGNAAAFCQ